MTPCLAVCLPTIQADTMSTVDTTTPPPVLSLDESGLTPEARAIIKRAVFVEIGGLQNRLKGVLVHHFDGAVSKLAARVDARLRDPASVRVTRNALGAQPFSTTSRNRGTWDRGSVR